MNRLDFFKDKLVVFILFPALGTLTLFTMDDSSVAWRIIAPTFFFGIATGTALYGLLKYKK